MSSALLQIRFFLCFAPVNLCRNEQSRINTNVFTKSELKLPATRRKSEQILHKGMLRSHLSSFSECHFTLQLAKSCAAGIRAAGNEIEIEKSRNSEDNNGNIISGSGNGDSNDNGHGNNVAHDEGPEHNHDEELTGVEWWWWWKWQQARHCDNNVSDLWPVDTAVQIVASEVKGTIEPAVRAIVLGPIRQHVSMQGLVLLLVFGVFVISCVQMFAGLAMVSTGVILAGVASLVLALMWRLWQQRPSQGQSSNGDGDNDHDD